MLGAAGNVSRAWLALSYARITMRQSLFLEHSHPWLDQLGRSFLGFSVDAR
jgi:hypothetical protein